MSAPKSIHVKESVTELKKLLKTSPRLIFPRIRMLLEIKKYESAGGVSKRILADAIGVNHNSIQTWRTLYANGGIEQLISYTKNEGRPSVLSEKEHQAIESKLNDAKNGLRGYVELLDWVENTFKKKIKYNTLLKYTNREFGASVKVARKSHVKKDPEAVSTFKKNFAQICEEACQKATKDYKEINLYFEDESRFGLFTKNGKALTAKAVKPICPFQQVFQSTYLFGAFSPINGASFLLELPYCNTDCFELFLNEFSMINPQELKVIVLDNGAFTHTFFFIFNGVHDVLRNS